MIVDISRETMEYLKDKINDLATERTRKLDACI
jgi:hypothetical protein